MLPTDTVPTVENQKHENLHKNYTCLSIMLLYSVLSEHIKKTINAYLGYEKKNRR